MWDGENFTWNTNFEKRLELLMFCFKNKIWNNRHQCIIWIKYINCCAGFVMVMLFWAAKSWFISLDFGATRESVGLVCFLVSILDSRKSLYPPFTGIMKVLTLYPIFSNKIYAKPHIWYMFRMVRIWIFQINPFVSGGW